MSTKFIGIGLAIVWSGAALKGQICVPEAKKASGYQHHEFRVEAPVGQVFISNKYASSCSMVKTHVPKGNPAPSITTDTFPDHLVTTLMMTPGAPSAYQATQVDTDNSSYEYTMSTVNAMGNPSDFVLELSPDPASPAALNMNLGYGSARLDLSDLSIEGIHIFAGSADVILTYNAPNRVTMKNMWITGGMSTITVRNIEKARAETIHIENGMGESFIFISSKPEKPMAVQLEVGAGSATIMVDQTVPLKIVLNDNIFSSIKLPPDMIETENNVFVNLPYKSNSRQSVTVYAELGIGSLEIITYDK